MHNIVIAWKYSWNKKSFRNNFTFSFGILLIYALCIPYYFQFIEARPGILIHDFILAKIPARDVSLPIFFIIWSTILLGVVRCVQSPSTCLLLFWSYLILNAFRVLTMTGIPLEAPEDLVQLKDPLSAVIYGGKSITKDLFFSGHTATQFMFFLCLKKPKDKIYALVGTIVLAILLLVQHVHYSFDVLAAPLFTWASCESAGWFIKQSRV